MPHYFGDALAEIKKIKGKDDGHLDFDTMPAFAVSKDGGRDIVAMVTLLVVAVQQLHAALQDCEKRIKELETSH